MTTAVTGTESAEETRKGVEPPGVSWGILASEGLAWCEGERPRPPRRTVKAKRLLSMAVLLPIGRSDYQTSKHGKKNEPSRNVQKTI